MKRFLLWIILAVLAIVLIGIGSPVLAEHRIGEYIGVGGAVLFSAALLRIMELIKQVCWRKVYAG